MVRLPNLSQGSVISGLSFVHYTGQDVSWLHSTAEVVAFVGESGCAVT